MASIVFNINDIKSLIDHHIAILERFNMANEAPFALIYFPVKNGAAGGEIFKRILRKTDALFIDGEHYIAMLVGTDWNGGVDLLSGIQEFLDERPADVIVTYPDDGTDAKSLMSKLQDTISDSYQIELKALRTDSPAPLFEI
ncbi:hypothetical protein [Campylobacter sp. 19-13652]|uniref:hypothetical protein n=1 Tax=Campylobacter sp. 19-13652 TaxID=2840180 RepID=UPI001C748503|nr:hypothetical protein [Campylobacter sp. 19-13652]BCX78992.1 hypothetical protein LBC_04540 [Campylobacter sp. 19-13652]